MAFSLVVKVEMIENMRQDKSVSSSLKKKPKKTSFKLIILNK